MQRPANGSAPRVTFAEIILHWRPRIGGDGNLNLRAPLRFKQATWALNAGMIVVRETAEGRSHLFDWHDFEHVEVVEELSLALNPSGSVVMRLRRT